MTPRTKREYLRELVADKTRWSRPLTDEECALGFLGWHERGYLPHCDFPGLVQFVTFRLADSMPTSRRGEWEHLLAIEDLRERRTMLEEYLDRGVGECHLRDPRIAKLCEDALLFFHDERYELLAWCVMPNHVHVLVHVWQTPLGKLVQSWKPGAFVVGMPYNMDGTESDMTPRINRFAATLTARYERPCHFIDERLSTRAAREISRNNSALRGKRHNDKANVDAMAAQLLLESWFDANQQSWFDES